MNIIKEYFRLLRIYYIRFLCLYRECNNTLFTHNALIIAPHPDDEVIGCAGLIQKEIKAKKRVDIVILSGGEASHNSCCDIPQPELKDRRRELTLYAAKILGLNESSIHFLNYPDGNINYSHPESDRLKALIERINPQSIFIPHKGEGWNDHIQVRNIIDKILSDKTKVTIYEYCVWFWYYNYWDIDWKNAFILKMSKEEHQKKNIAINSYIKPLAPCGRPYSGVLPKVFIKANKWKHELYFKI